MVSLGDKKFQNGKIYFIGNFIDDEIYIGSSCQSLQKRFQQHKDSMNSYKKNKQLYVKMIELGIEHFYIEEIEKCPCNNLEELRKRERHYIKERQPTLNKQIPTRTEKEWRADNKEYLQEYEKKRQEKTKKKSKHTNKNIIKNIKKKYKHKEKNTEKRTKKNY